LFRKVIILILINLFIPIFSFAKSPPERIPSDSKYSAIHNRLYLDLYRLITNLIPEPDASGETPEMATKDYVDEKTEETSRSSIYASDISAEQRYDIIDDDVQGQLWELGKEKLQRTSSVDVLYNTMEADLLIGGTAADGINTIIGEDITLDYPLSIDRDAPQIYISDSYTNYKISVETTTETIFISSFTSLGNADWSGRDSHLQLTYKDKLWVLGGQPDTRFENDVWSSSDGVNWTERNGDATWSDRAGHAGCIHENVMYITAGGKNSGNYEDDVYKSTDGYTFSLVNEEANFGKRSNHGMVSFNDKLWVIGGKDNSSNNENTVYYSDDYGSTWNLATDTLPGGPGRAGVFDNQMVWIREATNNVYSSEGGVYWIERSTGVFGTISTSHPYGIVKDKIFIINNNDELWYSDDIDNWYKSGDINSSISNSYQGSSVLNGILYLTDGYNNQNQVWKSNIDSSISFYNGIYQISDNQGKDHFRINQDDDITYINDKLSLNLNEDNRYLEDDSTNYEIDISTDLQVKGDINISSNSVYNINNLDFNTNIDKPSYKEGRIYWDKTDHTLSVMTESTGVISQVGLEQQIRCKNVNDHDIKNGDVVYISSAVADNGFPTVELAIASDREKTQKVIGMATENINIDSVGRVTVRGRVRSLNLSEFSVGDSLWLSTSTLGGKVVKEPAETNHRLRLGRVLSTSSTEGVIYFDPLHYWNAEDIKLNHFEDAYSQNVQDWLDSQSSGVQFGGNITDNGDGTVAVSSGTGLIKTENNEVADLFFFNWDKSTGVALTNNLVNWIYVSYNGGNPAIYKTTSFADINGNTEFLLGRAYREDNSVKIFDSGQTINNYTAKSFKKDLEVYGTQIASGFTIAETGTRNISITNGVYYTAKARKTSENFDSSSTETFKYVYRDGAGGFNVFESSSQIDNQRYDDGSGTLANLNNNYYGVFWVYHDFNGGVYVQYGQGNYLKLADAIDTTVPSTSNLLQNFAFLIGRIIIQKDGTTFEQIDSVTDYDFQYSPITDHNDLSGLQGGTAGERYHLSADEYTGNTTSDIDADKLDGYQYEHFLTTTGNHTASYIDFDEQLTESTPSADVERFYAFDKSGKTILKSENSDGITKTYAHDDISIVRNASTFTINTGELVYSDGSTGNVQDVKLAIATTTTKVPAIGVAIEDISSGGFGYIARRYELDGIDTSMFSEGDEVYLSTSTLGGIQNMEPTHPFLIQHVGTVLKSNAGAGIINFTIDQYVGHTEDGTIESTFSIGQPDSTDVKVEFYRNVGNNEDISFKGYEFEITTNVYINGYSSATEYYGDITNTSGKAPDSELLDGRNYDAFVSTAGDTMSGDLDMAGNYIYNVSSITGTGSEIDFDDNDLTNINEANINYYLTVSGLGAEIQGNGIGGDNVSLLVDSGLTSNGNIYMGDNKIVELSTTPTSSGDAIELEYAQNSLKSADSNLLDGYDSTHFASTDTPKVNNITVDTVTFSDGTVMTSTSDFSGGGGGGDNLGNHTATTTLDMAGNNIINASTITANAEVLYISSHTNINGDLSFSQDNYVESNVGCSVYLSADQSIPNTTITQIEFDTENYDLGNDFDTSTHKFTAPISGYYSIKSRATAEVPDDATFIMRIRINGSTYRDDGRLRNDRGSDAYLSPFVSRNIFLNNSDTVDIVVYFVGGDQIINSTERFTHLDINLISK